MPLYRLVTGCATASLCVAHGAALAAQAAAAALPASAASATAPAVPPGNPSPNASAPSPANPADGDGNQPQSVIVTGSAQPQRRFDVSYAVNSLSQSDLKKLAPTNYADMLGNLPGIHVESSGGEVQNITRVRGVPTDRGYLAFQQDGLPLFPEIDGDFWNSGEGANRLDLMTRQVEVVRGGPSPIYASQAAGIVNNITMTGSETPQGKAQVTVSDYGLHRLDLMQSGPLGNQTYYAIGGFVRQSDGYRPGGFPSDKGGQLRANIKHDLDNGSVKLSINVLNDHNVFYLPLPIANPSDPSQSLNQYINFFKGTLNTPALQDVNIKYLDGAGVLQNINTSLANGRHLKLNNLGLQYDASFDDWDVSAKGGWTNGTLQFDALYSTSNPSDANTFANSYLSSANAAFGSATNPVTSLKYSIAGTSGGTPYDPYSQSGLVMPAQYRYVRSNFTSVIEDVSASKLFETGLGKHDLKLGLYGALYSETNFAAYQNYLLQVDSQPQLLDLYAYSATGQKLGAVTQNGILNYDTTLNQGKVDANEIALYANDTWQITDHLRVDAGARHERYSYNGYALLSTSASLGDKTTLADSTSRAFTGGVQTHNLKPATTNWTLGSGYDFTRQLGGYVRLSHLEIPPQATVAYSVNPTIITTKLNEYEAGFKAVFDKSYLYLTAFYTKFDPLNASFAAYNPTTGQNDGSVPFIGVAKDTGIEADGLLHVASWFDINGSVTLSRPEYISLTNPTGQIPAHSVNGNQIIREPKVYGNIRPNFTFGDASNKFNFFTKYEYVGKRYVDYFNQTALPAYGEFSAGITITHNKSWEIQLVGDNLTNAHGLTEGNPRTDVLAGQGTPSAIYARPIFGRSFQLSLSKSW